ncbi:MAG: hypothetical protein WA123_02035, partial [Methylotenera sp.]
LLAITQGGVKNNNLVLFHAGLFHIQLPNFFYSVFSQPFNGIFWLKNSISLQTLDATHFNTGIGSI